MAETVSRRFLSALGQLALALLNATLILVVAALVLAWMLAGRVERIADTTLAVATDAWAEISSVKETATRLTVELEAIRQELPTLNGSEDATIEESSERLLLGMDQLETSLAEAQMKIQSMNESMNIDPNLLVEKVVRTGVSEFGNWIVSITDCRVAGN